jgi:hypothetical protein
MTGYRYTLCVALIVFGLSSITGYAEEEPSKTLVASTPELLIATPADPKMAAKCRPLESISEVYGWECDFGEGGLDMDKVPKRRCKGPIMWVKCGREWQPCLISITSCAHYCVCPQEK